MIRLRKLLTAVLAAALLSGCSASAEIQTSASPSAAVSVTAETRAEQIGTLLLDQDWKELSKMFSDDSSQEHSADHLKKLWNETTEEAPVQILDVFESLDDGRTAAYTLLSAGSQSVYAVCDLDENLAIRQMAFEIRPDAPVVENTESYTEEPIEIGNTPSVNGILTMPVDGEYPYLAILMPEGLSDPADASGSDAAFRKDLAHTLAENGIASIRYDMRLYEDPACAMDLSLDRIWFRDLASCIHSVEKYPVDAQHIIYIGHGISGTLGYSVCYHHFELTGGLVLLGSPYETGTEMMAQYYGIDAADQKQAEDELENDDADLSAMIGGYPLSYWKEWSSASPLIYTPHVAIPIAVFQGENDAVTAFDSDYEEWKSQKGSNVSMVSYTGMQHDMRDEDGTFTTLVSDIASWLNGDDIEEISEERHEAEASPSPSAGKKDKA